ncbi:DUF6520 family protein [uncultured Christiangramia sp.]|nr:DUF6520 family protein [uncultured Christiangramia sp.]
MKKLLLIPMMALLVVLGMSFTNFESETEEQPVMVASDYVLLNGNWTAIPEQSCSGTTYNCKVKFQENGQEFPVYDEMDDPAPKRSGSNEATLINLNK